MKILILALLVLGVYEVSGGINATCLCKNFDRKLFSKEGQQFIYKLLDLTKNLKESACGIKVAEMNGHGDTVLTDWENCKQCPKAPCMLSNIVQGSQIMTKHLSDLQSSIKAGCPALSKGAPKIIKAALDLNKKVLNECM